MSNIEQDAKKAAADARSDVRGAIAGNPVRSALIAAGIVLVIALAIWALA